MTRLGAGSLHRPGQENRSGIHSDRQQATLCWQDLGGRCRNEVREAGGHIREKDTDSRPRTKLQQGAALGLRVSDLTTCRGVVAFEQET